MNIAVKLLLVFGVISRSTYGRKGFGPGEQDWGYVTVRPQAHMFWWLYETTADVHSKTDRPLVIWLQGGPGASSTGLGNFVELGPLDLDLKPRTYAWTKSMNVLFIDNPVGAGFSYVDSESELAKTDQQVTEDLLECLREFYHKHPEFNEVPLYIIGESYGGKYTVELALSLDKETKAGHVESNLQGVVLVDSWISPIDFVSTWGTYLYNIGAVDHQGYSKIDESVRNIKKALSYGLFLLAAEEWGNTQAAVDNITFGADWYNILKKVPSENSNDEDEKLHTIMNGLVKQTLELNSTWNSQQWEVFSALRGEFMRSATNSVERILNETNIKVTVTAGQLDLVVDTPGTVQWVDRLRWSESTTWPETPRLALTVNGVNEGYKKILGRLALYWINRSGHLVPKDNPAAMEAILNDLMRN